MAKVSQIQIDGKNLLNSSQRVDWTRFKNTPTTLVSASGHNHDSTYYVSSTVTSKFKTEEDRITVLEKQIEQLAYKTDLMMGGGGSTGAQIHNYNFSTETMSQITTTLSNSPSNVPGITSKEIGFFLNSSKAASKFDKFTLVNTNISNAPITPKGSLIDFAIQTKGFINDGVDKWASLDVKLDTWTNKSSSTVNASGRQQLSSIVTGYTKGSGTNMLREYQYSSGISRDIIQFTTIDTTIGLNKSSFKGYWLSKLNGNFEHTYTTDIVQSFNTLISDANNSNVGTTEYYGVILGGGSSTSAYKLTWLTLTVSSSTNLTIDKNGASSIEF